MAIFDDNDFDEVGHKHSTIKMQDTFNITATTVSPLMQMDQNSEQRKRFVLVDGVYFNEPFFSANGFRGLLRRVMTKDMVEIIRKKEPNYKLKAEEFYLYSSGTSTDRKSIDNISWDEIPKLREKAPILSLFGAGLSSISGKCAVSDLKPISNHKNIKIVQNEDEVEIKKIMPLLQTQVFFRTDDFLKDTILKPLVDIEDITTWQKEHIKAVHTSKEKKKSGETQKETDTNIAQVIDIESIMPNVTLSNSINPLYGQKFTDIELGLLLKALLELSQMQIGSQKRLGYGVLDWHVELQGQAMFSVVCDKDYIFNRTITTSKKCDELIEIYNKWANENYS
uniref:RAMP superfamily CRISPR-associated protein n=1 Tax=Aliarcobacter sp. TaxID=2321116 RepID=UPI00404817D4